MDDVVKLLEDQLRENSRERSRLTTEAFFLREAARALRMGETLGVVMARLRARGIEPADWPAVRSAS